MGSKNIKFVQPLLNAYNLTYAVKINDVNGYAMAVGWSGMI